MVECTQAIISRWCLSTCGWAVKRSGGPFLKNIQYITHGQKIPMCFADQTRRLTRACVALFLYANPQITHFCVFLTQWNWTNFFLDYMQLRCDVDPESHFRLDDPAIHAEINGRQRVHMHVQHVKLNLIVVVVVASLTWSAGPQCYGWLHSARYGSVGQQKRFMCCEPEVISSARPIEMCCVRRELKLLKNVTKSLWFFCSDEKWRQQCPNAVFTLQDSSDVWLRHTCAELLPRTIKMGHRKPPAKHVYVQSEHSTDYFISSDRHFRDAGQWKSRH